MVVDLNFSKFDNTPFGFRLVGGSDFDIPLTVVKVAEDSIAERTGMRIGDVVVRINDIPTANLTHQEAHLFLNEAGNTFVLGVLRAKDDTASSTSTASSPANTIQSFSTASTASNASPLPKTPSPKRQLFNAKNLDDIIPDEPITDEQIAELLSGEAEVLKGVNILGVNFNRMLPKSGVFKQSEVFQTLNSEAIKTKEDKKKEEQRWTTFLQRPQRAVPKSALETEMENRGKGYQVKIVKQPKPRVAPDRQPTPPPKTPEPILPEPGPEPQYVEYLNEPEITEETIVPLEQTENNEINSQTEENAVENDTTEESEVDDGEDECDETESDEPEEYNQQLADVQQQLMALAALPNTIQATLAALSKQIEMLLPLQKQQKEKTVKHKLKSVSPKREESRGLTEERENDEIIDQIINDNTTTSTTVEETEEVRRDDKREIESQTSADTVITIVEQKKSEGPTQEEIDEFNKLEEERQRHEEEWEYKRQKEPGSTPEEELKNVLQSELQHRIKPKKREYKRSFGPLTPQSRPIFLPGGRKWRNPKDAFNEQFIAEVISSQAELITGTTLGSTYESPILGYDDRSSNCGFVVDEQDEQTMNEEMTEEDKVNFLKYKQPEKDISFIKDSDVYKMIHHMDAPRTGIEVRPEMVTAEQDIIRNVNNDNFKFFQLNQRLNPNPLLLQLASPVS